MDIKSWLYAMLAPLYAKALKDSNGQVAKVIGGLVVGVVMLFVGLFMIDAVSTATNLSANSSFATIQTSLITLTGTVFSVMGLVIIIVALATAIGSLRGVTAE